MSTIVRYGMVGGGAGAFIGAVHRGAAALDGRLQLVCGAFASGPTMGVVVRRWRLAKVGIVAAAIGISPFAN